MGFTTQRLSRGGRLRRPIQFALTVVSDCRALNVEADVKPLRYPVTMLSGGRGGDWRHFWRWALVASGAFVLGSPVAGLVYEGVAEAVDAHRYPPMGKLVDIGGRRLHLYCVGSGSPTVVVESGRSSYSVDWAYVQPAVARFTRICTYDRASYGWSDPNHTPRSLPDIAEELFLLLERANVPGPYVLVGHSMGGSIVRLFALRHPEGVTGMVLVDSVHEDAKLRWPGASLAGRGHRPPAFPLPEDVKRRFGLTRLKKMSLGAAGIPRPYRLLPPRIRAARLAFMIQPRQLEAQIGEADASVDNFGLLRAARRRSERPLGDLPLIVIAAEPSNAPALRSNLEAHMSAQRDLSTLSSKGRLVVAHGSGHFVQIERPEVVVTAIENVVAESKRR